MKHRPMRRIPLLLLVASLLTSCGLLGDRDPRNHAPPPVGINPEELRDLFGLERFHVGTASSQPTTRSMFVLDDGRWAVADLLYVDHPLSDEVTPFVGARVRDAITEVPNRVTGGTATVAERPPAVLDETFGCVRVVVSTHDFEPASELARGRFLAGVESGLARWLSELPEDPCDGRPTSPPAR